MSTTYEERQAELKARNPLIVLRHLLEGKEWTHDGRTYVLSDNYELCVVAWAMDKSKGITWENRHEHPECIRYLRTDVSLAGFIKMAEEVSLDEAFIMSAEVALQQINKERR